MKRSVVGIVGRIELLQLWKRVIGHKVNKIIRRDVINAFPLWCFVEFALQYRGLH